MFFFEESIFLGELQEAGAAEAFTIACFQEGALLVIETDAITLAMGHIAHLAFEAGIATGTFLVFMLAHIPCFERGKRFYDAGGPVP